MRSSWRRPALGIACWCRATRKTFHPVNLGFDFRIGARAVEGNSYRFSATADSSVGELVISLRRGRSSLNRPGRKRGWRIENGYGIERTHQWNAPAILRPLFSILAQFSKQPLAETHWRINARTSSG